MKAVKAHLQATNPERVEAFEKGAQAFAKKIIANFKDYEFYIGESMNPDGMVALLVSSAAKSVQEPPLTLAELPRGRHHPLVSIGTNSHPSPTTSLDLPPSSTR